MEPSRTAAQRRAARLPIDTFDWSSTPLGAPALWSDDLLDAVQSFLESRPSAIATFAAIDAAQPNPMRELMEPYAQAVWEAGPDGVVRKDSPSWRLTTGQSKRESLGRGWLDAVHPEDRELAEREWQAAVEHKQIMDAEFRLQRAGGDWQWTHVRAMPVVAADGSIEKWIGMNFNIDQRKRAEAASRESEARLQLALDAARMGTFVWHIDEDRGEPDARMRELLGVSATEPTSLAKTLATQIHPMDRPRIIDAVRDACDPNGSGVLREDVRMLLSKGGHRWLAITAQVHFGGSPRRALHMTGAAFDITDRKDLEAALRESSVRIQTIITEAATAVVEADATGRMTLVNRRWCEMLGYEESELLGMNIADVTHPDSLESTLAAVRKLAAGGPSFEIEKVYLRKDGTPLIATSNVSALRGPNGEYRGLIAVVVDITSRKRAEQALRDSEERFRQFGEASSDVLWLRDAKTLQWEYLSKAFDAIYGLPRSQILKDNTMEAWLQLIEPADRANVLSYLERVRAGENVTFEFRIRRPNDGEVRWIRNTDFPVSDQSQRIHRIGGIAQDITEEKHTSGRLQVLVEELQHRTRNIIAIARSLANKTLEECVSLEEFKHSYNERLAAVARTQGLLSKLDEGQRITFGELLRAELSAHERFANLENRIVLEGPQNVRLRTGALQTFALALHELTTNAIKYGALSTAGGMLTIKWHVERDAYGKAWLHVDWRESGVAVDRSSTPRGGYGRELIERALPYQLQAETSYDLGSEGVHCTIAVPISSTH